MPCCKRIWPLLLALAALAGQRWAVEAGPPDYTAERAAMVDRLRESGMSQFVLAAMRRVPRHEFVAANDRARAYDEVSISTSSGQVLPPPRTVAISLSQLDPRSRSKILQVGCECGYCTALLCEIGARVYAMDSRPDLLRTARFRAIGLGYSAAAWLQGKACLGHPGEAPFDAILVMCAADRVPEALVRQLRDGGHMVVPVGEGPEQTLLCVTKQGDRLRAETIMPVRTDPMDCRRRRP